MSSRNVEGNIRAYNMEANVEGCLESDHRKYTPISPILAPFFRSGRSFSTNSVKTDTIVLGIPRFSAHSAVGGYIEAGNNR